MIEKLNSIDKTFFLFLNSFHSEALNGSMVFLSGQAIWIPFIAIFLWLSYKKLGTKPTLFFALFLLMTIIASDSTSSYIIKNIINRLRPCRELDLKPLIYSFGQKCGGKFGFVSSHAANAFAIVLFSARALKLPRKTVLLLLLIPLIVSYSRVYLGVHYPGDILGGILIGTFWSYFFSWAYQNFQGANR